MGYVSLGLYLNQVALDVVRLGQVANTRQQIVVRCWCLLRLPHKSTSKFQVCFYGFNKGQIRVRFGWIRFGWVRLGCKYKTDAGTYECQVTTNIETATQVTSKFQFWFYYLSKCQIRLSQIIIRNMYWTQINKVDRLD